MMTGWLSGWKEIATYLNVSVSTAQKYYKDFNMPVRKIDSRKKISYARVKALRPELDLWLIKFDDIRTGRKNSFSSMKIT